MSKKPECDSGCDCKTPDIAVMVANAAVQYVLRFTSLSTESAALLREFALDPSNHLPLPLDPPKALEELLTQLSRNFCASCPVCGNSKGNCLGGCALKKAQESLYDYQRGQS